MAVPLPTPSSDTDTWGSKLNAFLSVTHNSSDSALKSSAIISALGGVSSAYTVTNSTTDRVFDANSTSLDELADVLATLIADLQHTGLIG